MAQGGPGWPKVAQDDYLLVSILLTIMLSWEGGANSDATVLAEKKYCVRYSLIGGDLVQMQPFCHIILLSYTIYSPGR